jgi:hypothetical protein
VGGFEKKMDNLTGSHQLKKNSILENRSGSHNVMREPEPAGSHKKVRTAPTLEKTLTVYLGWLGTN